MFIPSYCNEDTREIIGAIETTLKTVCENKLNPLFRGLDCYLTTLLRRYDELELDIDSDKETMQRIARVLGYPLSSNNPKTLDYFKDITFKERRQQILTKQGLIEFIRTAFPNVQDVNISLLNARQITILITFSDVTSYEFALTTISGILKKVLPVGVQVLNVSIPLEQDCDVMYKTARSSKAIESQIYIDNIVEPD